MDVDPTCNVVEFLLGGERDESDSDTGQRGELLPVLWSTSSPWMLPGARIPHVVLIPDRMYVGLATVAPTPRGTIGVSHLMADSDEEPFFDLLADACANLIAGLKIDGYRGDGGELLTMHRERGLASSAVALPDFHERAADLLGAEQLIVGLTCPHDLFAAPAGSVWAERINEMVLSSTYPSSELVPSVLLLDGRDIHLVAERGENGY